MSPERHEPLPRYLVDRHLELAVARGSGSDRLPMQDATLHGAPHRRHEAQPPLSVLRLSLRASGWRGLLVIAPSARVPFTMAAHRASRTPRG
ncbi:MAG: hypothetical protein IT379_09940 [Deltaproteobacteria bacterium]|nr:hypothetical protein [Deltaproteobacteria bacterium]